LHISQPALTKQIQDLEGYLNARVFERDHQRVKLTDAGDAFVAEARIALLHHQRAIHAAESAANGVEAILSFGQSPYIDPILTTIIAAVHLPLYPNCRLHMFSDYSPELARRVATGELDMAVFASVGESTQLRSVELSRSPFYMLLDRNSVLAGCAELKLQDMKDVPWILFARQMHPPLYESIAEKAQNDGVSPPERHHVTSAEQAAQLVKSTGGIAFLPKAGAWRVAVEDLTIRPLAEPGIVVRTVLVTRNDPGRLVSEFMRAIVRKVRQISGPTQGRLALAI
jgi:DNA-binding transcriptional LysR family regulator